MKFSECRVSRTSVTKRTVIDKVNFVLNDADTLYIDLLEFHKSFAKQSRDKVVHLAWQCMTRVILFSELQYKWSKAPIPSSPLAVDEKKKKSLQHIESRLRNWYATRLKHLPAFQKEAFCTKGGIPF